jgi:UDP-hydrolysing UDP-N-acetyl-D-glucosamine 2-epimerase
MSKSTGLGMIGFSDAYMRLKPDLVVVLGDRFEILAAASAAMLQRIPLAHIAGGEVTEGAIDESIRHAVTKMASFHFTAAESYRKRVIRMGEEPWRVVNSGATGLDSLRRLPLISKTELEAALDFHFQGPMLLVTYHPATLGKLAPGDALQELLRALDRFAEGSVLFTLPNADPGGRLLAKMITEHAAERPHRVKVVTSLGQLNYLSAMSACEAVVGNSSSGIIEAPSLGKPTVNIGSRQQGRLRTASIIDCDEEEKAIAAALERALSQEFRALAAQTPSLYGDGNASAKIVAYLKNADLTSPKRFHDPPTVTGA